MINKLVRQVMERSENRCHYCGDTATQLLPIVPSILGGDTDDAYNLLAVCTPDLRRFESLLSDAIVVVAARHVDELAAEYGNGILRLGYEPVHRFAEIPGQTRIEDFL